ncbi:Amidase [Corchorus olitorius]|uniref:Amidase n=1 Tax=Corchorus olitorius TaxID=93759 RepID=A0A1R3JW97_9ROSI|nr:Amidase [Corchorus olitorius]
MAETLDYGAFMEKFTLQLIPSSHGDRQLPLSGLTFAVKDIIYGENKHYGTPRNPCAPDRVPGGSSSGSAVAVSAMMVDFSLGTDTGSSVRLPASYCGIFGFRPSHDAISTIGVLPLAQSFDTVEDCFCLSSVPRERTDKILLKSVEKLFGGQSVKHITLGDYINDKVPSLQHIMDKVPSLQHIMDKENDDQDYNIPSMTALSSAMRLLQRYEFKNNHAEWVTKLNPDLGPGIFERAWEAIRSTGENIDVCNAVRRELRAALTTLLGEHGIIAIPTAPGDPPKLQTDPATLATFRARAFSLLSIAGLTGFCQVSIPLGMHNNLPVSISLLAKHGSDGFLLNLVETLYGNLKEQIAMMRQ